MSLVNDVLKDLGERNHPFAGAALCGSEASGPDLTNAIPVRQFTKRAWPGSKSRVTVTLFLAGFAFGGVALHRTAQAPGLSDLVVAILPKYIQPIRGVSTFIDKKFDMEQKNIADNVTESVPMAPQKSEPKTRVSIDGPTASKHPLPKNKLKKNNHKTKANKSTLKVKNASLELNNSNPASNKSAYIEVIHRPLSAEQRLLNDLHVAANFYKTGDYAEAEVLLKDLLAQDDGQHQARLLLARLYVLQKLDGRAELVMSNGLLRYPEHVAYVSLYAQILAGQGRDNAAIDVLQQALPSAVDNADFHALLAGIYQRTGNSAQAAKSYLTALQIDPKHGEWWMGLGISSEQAGDGDAAEGAYTEALLHPIAKDIEQYVQQRLQQLSAKKAASTSQAKK